MEKVVVVEMKWQEGDRKTEPCKLAEDWIKGVRQMGESVMRKWS